MLRFMRKMEKV